MDETLSRDIVAAVDAGFDERLCLDSLKKVTRAIALFIADSCGLEKHAA